METVNIVQHTVDPFDFTLKFTFIFAFILIFINQREKKKRELEEFNLHGKIDFSSTNSITI